MKLMIQGKVQGRRGRGHPCISYISNMTSWIGCNIEQLFKLAQDRERWHEADFNAARAANIKYDDAVTDWVRGHNPFCAPYLFVLGYALIFPSLNLTPLSILFSRTVFKYGRHVHHHNLLETQLLAYSLLKTQPVRAC